MQIQELNDSNTVEKCILTFGNFDGIHLGHRHLLDQVINLGKKNNLPVVLLTFDPHTNKIVFNNKKLKVLTSFDDKANLLTSANIDVLCKIIFNEKFAKLKAEEFIDIIISKYNPKIIMIGYDNYFGFNKEGSYNFLIKNKKFSKIEIITTEKYTLDGENIKSSVIKKLLTECKIEKVNNFIGRKYSLKGVVSRGDNISTLTGFKTANIKLKNNEQLIPGNGVYSVSLRIDKNDYPSVCNIGYCPTIKNSSKISIEVHVIDESLELYNKSAEVFFNRFIRAEKKFDNVQNLKNQISKDIKSIKERILNRG